jgi:nicotinate-nucleotide--dimethylbenzimidazole phosphoribosyltransferase
MTDSIPVPTALDHSLETVLREKIAHKTKPPGSLGRLESLALQIGLIQRSAAPQIRRPVMLVFAGDHGITEAGVSSYPQAVTVQMVANFLAGGAAINALSRVAGMTLEVINAGVAGDLQALPGLIDIPINALSRVAGMTGVAGDLPTYPGLIDIPVARGTRNFAREPAMTRAQAEQAMAAGAARVRHHAVLGSTVIGFGEMGIGNTSSAACLMSRLCRLPLAQCVGRGTGLDDAGLARKQAILEAALERHDETAGPLAILACFGGFEIAMMVGAFLAAAEAQMTILVDGFIASTALLVAVSLAPATRDYCVFAHQSDEAGHRKLLEFLGAEPLLALGLRLGEGTGAALALPLLYAATAFLNEMASFGEAGVSDRRD